MKQMTFASSAWEGKKKQTRRERFLAEMESVVPWAALLAVMAAVHLALASIAMADFFGTCDDKLLRKCLILAGLTCKTIPVLGLVIEVTK